MRQLALGVLFFMTAMINGCNSSNDCGIISTNQFEGDGVLLLENTSTQDGKMFITFFPVCKLDTTDLLFSLQHSKQGIIFRANSKSVWQAVHKRATVLQSLEKHRLRFNREVYLTPIHLAYHEMGEEHAESSKPAFRRTLNTKQLNHSYQVREIIDLKIDILHGI